LRVLVCLDRRPRRRFPSFRAGTGLLRGLVASSILTA
jgi:hypothetical protein